MRRYSYWHDLQQLRPTDDVLQLVLFACWTIHCLRTVNAFTLLGSTVMREASKRERHR